PVTWRGRSVDFGAVLRVATEVFAGREAPVAGVTRDPRPGAIASPAFAEAGTPFACLAMIPQYRSEAPPPASLESGAGRLLPIPGPAAAGGPPIAPHLRHQLTDLAVDLQLEAAVLRLLNRSH